VQQFLDGMQSKLRQVGDEVTRTCFNTHVILPAAKMTAAAAQQQQQQSRVES
jgi:hypothetical protein